MEKKNLSESIGEEFFRDYAGSGKAYSRVWRQHCYFDECCALFKDPKMDLPSPKTIMVLGSATGEICTGFYRAFGRKAHGCESSRWAHAQTPDAFRRNVRCADMRDYVASLTKQGKVFDLTFSNSLIYLPERNLGAFLKALSRRTRYLHFHSSFTGSACPDPWRRTLRPYAWWIAKLRAAGFEAVPGSRGARTYLWASRNCK